MEAATAELRETSVLLPGIAQLLEKLHEEPGVTQTLLTGNLEPNARVKLRLFGLDRWLDLEIGAYGSDHVDRDALVPIALEKARRVRGLDFSRDHVWVIGDTERDLVCARAANVRCLLVGTGRAGLDAVASLPADAIMPDLSEAEDVFSILGLAEELPMEATGE